MRLNSYDGFTRLREVIVGSGTGYTGHDRDLTFELFHQENLLHYDSWHYPRLAAGEAPERWAVHPQYVEERCSTAFTAPGAPNRKISTSWSSSRQRSGSTCRGRSVTSSP